MSNGNRRAIDFATLLYRQLPSVYRERDDTTVAPDGTTRAGTLALLAAGWGNLLDALYRTLQQRYYDVFPEIEGEADAEGLERGCQDWVLPYIAQLLDVRLLSPIEGGQRRELQHAVEWRQRKGTLRIVEEIAEAIAGLEVEPVEGWRRVAVTPRPGFTLLPAEVFGEPDPERFGGTRQAHWQDDARYPLRRAEHPGLPCGTVDFRRPSRAVAAAPGTPSSRRTRFGSVEATWRQAWPHGVPCFPDSFQDASARLPDLRTPDGRRGHAHPRRVVLHVAPLPGFFSAAPVTVRWADIRAAVQGDAPWPAQVRDVALRISSDDDSGAQVRTLAGVHASPVRITGVVELDGGGRPVLWEFGKLWFDNRVEIARSAVHLEGCAVRQLRVHDAPPAGPAVVARDTLFMRLFAATGLAQLEAVTVLEQLVADGLQASDCLFVPQPHRDLVPGDADVPGTGCIRYSRLPRLPSGAADPLWTAQGRPSALKVFADSCRTQEPIFCSTHFGSPGCAVLHPDTSAALRFGAEDGGEMGAYHALAYTLREQAVIAKLQDALPLDMEAVLATDASLGTAPPVMR